MKDVKKEKAANFKLITTTTGVRVSQACDRCRIKKIKCNGLTPCHHCEKIGLECKTSDKLTRRAFPKGYTENLEKRVKELEEELDLLRSKNPEMIKQETSDYNNETNNLDNSSHQTPRKSRKIMTNTQHNNPIDQIFNLNKKGMIIGNDNLNFESQFNHLLINLNLPFLKITNSHNYLLNDHDSYLYHPSYTTFNQMHNSDLEVIYNPLTETNKLEGGIMQNKHLPSDIYDLFIKLINNFKNIFNNKRELDNQVAQFFLNYNIIIPIFDYRQFMKSYDEFHTMYPFMFTYDDATINGFNILNNDYNIVNQYLMTVIQIYAMIMMNDPAINLNLLLNHSLPNYVLTKKAKVNNKSNLINSLYDFLPYINVYHISVENLQTYLLFLYYSLLTNNKEKSLIISSLINSFIGILGINLNSKNLFFNDLSLSLNTKRNRVKIFWAFKVLLKCFNLKFGYKPSLNTTVINPVTIDRYFQLTPEKLSSLLEVENGKPDDLFTVLLKPSVEFLNLLNIIIPSSFSPNYYQYLKNGSHEQNNQNNKKHHPILLDSILNDDDGDGNDGNLNYNFTQFVTIDKNLEEWRESIKSKEVDISTFQMQMNLPVLSKPGMENLYHDLINQLDVLGLDAMISYYNNGISDVHTAFKLIKIQLNMHYLLIRSMNYLNFVIDKELNHDYYIKLLDIAKEVLNYFLLVFDHIALSTEVSENNKPENSIMASLGIDVDEDGFVINDFSVKRRRHSHANDFFNKRKIKQIPQSPFNYMLNGLSITIINFKKSIILQMLFMMVCQLKFLKKGESFRIGDSPDILNKSIDLFIKCFINYEPDFKNPKKLKENELFKKIINDELKDEILKKQSDSDDEDADENEIDWDDENMDEDLKYLKILKFIKYKNNLIQERVSAGYALSNPTQVTHHHHMSHIPSHTSMNYFGNPGLLNYNPMNKIPSETKFDFLLSDENFPNHTMGSPYGKNAEMMRKERLAVNDLVHMKNGHNNALNNNQWSYGPNAS